MIRPRGSSPHHSVALVLALTAIRASEPLPLVHIISSTPSMLIEFARHNDLALRVDRVNLKHPLSQIETNPRDSRQIPDRLAHGRLPFRWGFDNDHLGTLMPFGAPSTPSFRCSLAMAQVDPLLPFEVGPMNERYSQESGLRLTPVLISRLALDDCQPAARRVAQGSQCRLKAR